MSWCPVDADECPTYEALAAGTIHDNGGTDFSPVREAGDPRKRRGS